MKLAFTAFQGHLTKLGASFGSIIIIVENALAFFNGAEFQNLVRVGQETWSSLGLLGSLALTTWGGFRAAINYNGHTK